MHPRSPTLFLRKIPFGVISPKRYIKRKWEWATRQRERKNLKSAPQLLGGKQAPRAAAAPQTVRDGGPGLSAKREELKQNKQCVITPPNLQLGNEGEKHLPLITHHFWHNRANVNAIKISSYTKVRYNKQNCNEDASISNLWPPGSESFLQP